MQLPGIAQEIADVIGRDDTLALIGNLPRCGQRAWRVNLYVPKRLKPQHWLVEELGWEKAHALSKEFGGQTLEPSRCVSVARTYRNKTIWALRESGSSCAEIALAFGLSARQVRNITAKQCQDQDQGTSERGMHCG